MSRTVVIGVGNPFRRDDGVGPAVTAALREHPRRPDLAVDIASDDPAALLDALAGADHAIVVDAVRCDPAMPGRIHRIEAGTVPLHIAVSSHGWDVFEAIRLADVLGRTPRQLVVIAVEAAELAIGSGLSPAVTDAVPSAVQAVLAELDRAMTS